MQAVRTTFKCGSTFTTSGAKVKSVMICKVLLRLNQKAKTITEGCETSYPHIFLT
jgi:hypothetical protein